MRELIERNFGVNSDPEDQLLARIRGLQVHRTCWMNELVATQIAAIVNPNNNTQAQQDYMEACTKEIKHITSVLDTLTKR